MTTTRHCHCEYLDGAAQRVLAAQLFGRTAHVCGQRLADRRQFLLVLAEHLGTEACFGDAPG